MKYLFTAIALTTLAASPAFAASHKYTDTDHMPAAATNAYASMFDPYSVVQGNQVLGRDPDANVRLQLRQNGWTIDNGGN